MIRAWTPLTIAACAVALPAQALDFAGLRPGMPASSLAQLGESEYRVEGPDNIIEAIYPRPFGQRIRIMHDGERILFVEASGDDHSALPETDGLQAWRATLSEAVDFAGSEGWFFEQEGQVSVGTIALSYRLSYDLKETDDYSLALVFFDVDGVVDQRADGLLTLPPDIPLLSAELIHRDLVTAYPALFGTDRVDRPGAAPFNIPLSEAFPLIDLPQD